MKTTSFIIVFFVCYAGFSQDGWFSTNLSQGTIRMGSAILGSKAYFAGGAIEIGSNWYTTDKVEIYDMGTNQWQLTNLSIARQWTAAVTCGDSIFVGGGMSASAQPYSRVDVIYNDALCNIAELSIPRLGLSAVSHDSLVLFAGGFNLILNEAYDVIDVYNANSHEWSFEYLSVPRGAMGCAILGDRVFFAGGCDGSNSMVYDRVDIYNFTTGTWDTATLSQARSFIGAATAGNKVIFAGGSLGMGMPSDRVDIYDSETDEWETANLSIARGFWGNQAATACGKAYFVGSGIFNFGWDTDTDTIDVYDPYIDDPLSVMTMPNRLNDHAVVSTDTSMLIAGGFTFIQFPNGFPQSDVEIYDLQVGINSPQNDVTHSEAFPNPFVGCTTINYELEQSAIVNLSIYNHLAQQVVMLEEGERAAGKHQVQWNAEGLPGGIYYYRMTTDDRRLTTKKLVKY